MISPLKKTIINLPIRLKGNSKRTSSNSLSLVAEGSNKDLGAVSQMLTQTSGWDVSRVLLPQGKSYTNEKNINTSWNLN